MEAQMTLLVLWRMAARGLVLRWYLWAQREMRRGHIDESFVVLRISELRRAIAKDYDTLRNQFNPPAPRRPGR